jgi:hypothetical protein
MKSQDLPPLMDLIRPSDKEGALQSVLLSTYGLSLSDPPFFEQDFLPTLLGLGGVRERGYSAPANVERKLGQIYCGLACDAHALARGGRPSLRVDVMPVGRQLHHAKVVLIHRERFIRLVIASANLTHEGYRRNRETAAVLDFHESSELSPGILLAFADQWIERLGNSVTADFKRALAEAVSVANSWQPSVRTEVNIQTVWGGGSTPLWRRVVEAWPQNEKLLEWSICSPFWPEPSSSETPFDAMARGLEERGAKVAEANLKLYALADSSGPCGRPFFPYLLVEQLTSRGFNPAAGTINPARLDALDFEVPDGKAEDIRPLHAKWILLKGEKTSLILLGSANFTRKGFGALRDPSLANIEVCVLLSGPSKLVSAASIIPPIAEEGIVNWVDCQPNKLASPQMEIELEPWPDFINGVELGINWEAQPLRGVLQIRCTDSSSFHLFWESADDRLPIVLENASADGTYTSYLNDIQISALLVRRRVVVHWSNPTQEVYFPINVASDCKTGLPAVLGQNPTEQDLLAYFHGRINEEDLMSALMERARANEEGGKTVLTPPGQELQNYVIREFLEGLYGMEDILRSSMTSDRIFEQALLGEFSPVRLANETRSAFAAGRRTATATGFQLVELVRLVENLHFGDDKKAEPDWFDRTRDRCMVRLFEVVKSAATHQDFVGSCQASSFQELIAGILSAKTVSRWGEALKSP